MRSTEFYCCDSARLRQHSSFDSIWSRLPNRRSPWFDTDRNGCDIKKELKQKNFVCYMQINERHSKYGNFEALHIRASRLHFYLLGHKSKLKWMSRMGQRHKLRKCSIRATRTITTKCANAIYCVKNNWSTFKAHNEHHYHFYSTGFRISIFSPYRLQKILLLLHVL